MIALEETLTMIDTAKESSEQQPESKKKKKKSDKPRRRSLFSVLFNTKVPASDAPKSGKEAEKMVKGSGEEDGVVNNNDNNNNNNQDNLEKQEFERTSQLMSISDDGLSQEEDEEEDSYELDLTKRVAREKLLQCNKSTIVKRPARVPSDKQTVTKQAAGEEKTPTSATSKGKSKSPLLEQFLNSNKIHLETMDGFDSCSEDEGCRLDSSDMQQVGRHRDEASERDMRLAHWRLMAARSMWSASPTLSSDSELDLLDCQNPAMVVDCSDDTSCSSVELVWSRPRAPTPATGSTRAVLHHPINSVTPPEQQQIIRNTSQKISSRLTKSQDSIGSLSRSNSVSVSPAEAPQTRALVHNIGIQRITQRLSIFELAKPSKSKCKQMSNRESPCKSGANWVANPLFSDDGSLDVPAQVQTSGDGSLDSSETKSSSNINRWLRRNSARTRKKLKTEHLSDSERNNGNKTDDGSHKSESLFKRRWSARGRSPFLAGENRSKSSAATKGDNIYLNQIMELDRRIKSNMSSFKSQLSVKISDTSKRASILADQFITSIKDTTKEQLLGLSSTKDESVAPNTFALDECSNLDTEKAKQFSLIYRHQQPTVVTRQPTGLGFGPISTDKLPPSSQPSTKGADEPSDPTTKPKEEEEKVKDRVQSPPLEEVKLHEDYRGKPPPLNSPSPHPASSEDDDTDDKTSSASISSSSTTSAPSNDSSSSSSSDSLFHSDAFVTSKEEPHFSQSSNLDISQKSRVLDTPIKETTTRKRSKRTKRRKQANVAPESDCGEDEPDFYHHEFVKVRNSLNKPGNDSSLRKQSFKLKSLNYWRRFRMRHLDWKLQD